MNVGDDYYLTKWFIRINGDGKNKPSQILLYPDKIQAPAVDYSKNHFAPAANHAANEFFVGTYLKPSFTLRKGGQVVCFRLGLLETCEIRCGRQWVYREFIRCQ